MNRTLTKHLTTLWPALLCFGGVASGDESSPQGAAIFPSGHAAQTAEGAGELPEWWNAPAERDRHTTLLARFDARDRVDVEYERACRGAAGRNYDAAVAGRHGGGLEIDAPGAQMNFSARNNMRAERGTVGFWIRSKPGRKIWSDSQDHWFFSAAASENNLELWKDAGNRLRLS